MYNNILNKTDYGIILSDDRLLSISDCGHQY
jgi:hypothetical protein